MITDLSSRVPTWLGRGDLGLFFPVFIESTTTHTQVMQKVYCVYIITNFTNTVLYTGVTGNLTARIYRHKSKAGTSFSSRYNLNKLVYYEVYEQPRLAIMREKQIKAGSRNKKLALINGLNPRWSDLYGELA